MSESIESSKTVALKEDSESIELKELMPAEQTSMPLARVVEESTAETSKPVVESPESVKSADFSDSSAPVVPSKTPGGGQHGGSRGMFRHKLVLASTCLIALTAFGINGFDLGFLIFQDGKIDRNFNFTADKGNPALPASIEYVEPNVQGALRPVHESNAGEGKVGFADEKGHVVIPTKFYAVKAFSEGLAAVKVKWNDGWQFIDTSGNIVIPTQYSSAGFFHLGYARVIKESNGKLIPLVIGRKGQIVDLHGAEAVKEAEGFFVVKKADKCGLMKASKLIIPFQYDDIDIAAPKNATDKYSTDASGPSGGDANWHQKSVKPFFKLSKNGLYGLADNNGKLLFTPRYDDILNVANGHAVVSEDSQLGFSDLGGKLVIPTQYDQVTQFDELIAVAQKGGKIIFIDSSLKPVNGLAVDNIKFDFNTLQWLHDGLGLIKRKGLYGYVDARGREVIPAIYKEAQAFDGGVARVGDGSKTIYIDRNGKQVSPNEYLRAAQFKGGKADVTIRGPFAYSFRDLSKVSWIAPNSRDGADAQQTDKGFSEFEADDFEAE